MMNLAQSDKIHPYTRAPQDLILREEHDPCIRFIYPPQTLRGAGLLCPSHLHRSHVQGQEASTGQYSDVHKSMRDRHLRHSPVNCASVTAHGNDGLRHDVSCIATSLNEHVKASTCILKIADLMSGSSKQVCTRSSHRCAWHWCSREIEIRSISIGCKGRSIKFDNPQKGVFRRLDLMHQSGGSVYRGFQECWRE